MNVTHLSDPELLSHLHSLAGQARVVLARLLATLGEVEERRLHLAAACSSLFQYCVERLGMSEGEAFRRITAARLARRFPILLERIERGELHLSALLLLRDHLTVENHLELIAEASGKSRRKLEEMLALRFPRPDAPSRVWPISPYGVVHPLSAGRYRLELTMSAELLGKLQRVVDLMRHRNPHGDLAVVVEAALDLLLAKLEKERLAKTTRPARETSTARTTRPGYVTNAARREAFERDGEQCTFVDAEGRRCTARGFLELDHIEPRARGGGDDATNLRVRCRAHNGWEAERAFGRQHVERQIHLRRRKYDPSEGMGGAHRGAETGAGTTETQAYGSPAFETPGSAPSLPSAEGGVESAPP